MVSHGVTAAECKEVSKKYCAIIHFSTTMQLDLTLFPDKMVYLKLYSDISLNCKCTVKYLSGTCLKKPPNNKLLTLATYK